MHTSSASSASLISHQGDSDPGCVGECVSVIDESAALLPSTNQNIAESQALKPLKTTPVPKLQLATLCLIRMLEPIGFTQLFPYVNEMVVKLNIVEDPSKAGFVSGLVVSNWLSMRWVPPSGCLIRSLAGEHLRHLSIDVNLPLGQAIRRRWPASGCPPRGYRGGSHDIPLRVFPQFGRHARYEKFTWFLHW